MADTRLKIGGLIIECSRESIVGYAQGRNPSWTHKCTCGVTHRYEADGSIHQAIEVFVETYTYEDGETSDIYELRCRACGMKIEWPNTITKQFAIPGLVDVRFSGVLVADRYPVAAAFGTDMTFEDESGIPRFRGYITGVDTSDGKCVVTGNAIEVFPQDDAG